MATRKRTTTKPRRDIEAEVTDKIIAALEQGTVPWRKPWTAAGILPTSVSTGKPYRGINVWLLSLSAMANDYASPYWLTFEQAKQRGGSVRKGEKGTLVVFWKRLEVADKDAVEPDAKKSVFMMRHYTVFNLEQTDDVQLPPRFAPPEPGVAPDPIDAAEALWGSYEFGPELKYAAGDSAHYNPSTDVITLPEREQFETAAGYYGTLFHEGTHSTGHASRLNRFERGGEPSHFGSERYAREELVAEMGSAMLMAQAGIDTDATTEHSAAYIANWLGALRDDKSLVSRAAQQAQKAVDRILGTTFESTEEVAA